MNVPPTFQLSDCLQESSAIKTPIQLSEACDRLTGDAQRCFDAIVSRFAKQLYLPLSGDSVNIENSSSVCFAESPELPEDQKPQSLPRSFSRQDVIAYIIGYFTREGSNLSTGTPIPYPTSQIQFWELVRTGATCDS